MTFRSGAYPLPRVGAIHYEQPNAQCRVSFLDAWCLIVFGDLAVEEFLEGLKGACLLISISGLCSWASYAEYSTEETHEEIQLSSR